MIGNHLVRVLTRLGECMRKGFCVVIGFLSLILFTSSVSQPLSKPTISVLNLTSAGGINRDEAVLLTDRLLTELTQTGYFQVTERDRRDEILREVAFQLSGACDEASCLAKAGKYLGVQKMVGGTVGGIGETYSVNLRMVDVETGRIERTALKDYQGSIDNLLTMAMQEVAWQFVPEEYYKKYQQDSLRRVQAKAEQPKSEGPVFKGSSWTAKAPMPTPRGGLAVAASNNRIYALGGLNEGAALAAFEEYDPLRNAWVSRSRMLTPRFDLASCIINNKLFAIGGVNNRKLQNTVEEYNLAQSLWIQRTSMPTARQSLSLGVVSNRVYAIGGWDGKNTLSTVEMYDPLPDTWSVRAPLPTPRRNLAVGVVYNMVYAIGGSDGRTVLSTVEEYDPITNTWLTKDPMPTARINPTVSVVSNVIYVIGGVDGKGLVLSTVEAYDPILNRWVTKTAMPTKRGGGASCVLSNKIYVIGGANEQANLAIMEKYDPACDP